VIQNLPVESVSFTIEPAKPKEVIVTPERRTTHIIEIEKKDEETHIINETEEKNASLPLPR
jgi:hypothetical protein